MNENKRQSSEQNTNEFKGTDQFFRRKFRNLDMTACWLNSSLQLLLNAMDHSESKEVWTSELGEEWMQLPKNQNFPLDATIVKQILVTTEDTRVATRISELASEIDNPYELEHRTQNLEDLRLDLISGQQCVRDFFLCLNENFLSWPDVYSTFGFKITHSTSCCSCNNVNQSETTQMYIELQVPPDNSNLNDHIEDYLNTSSQVAVYCENGCQSLVQAEKRSTLTRTSETEFLIVILTRAVETMDGFHLNKNKVTPTNDVFIR